MTATWQWVTLTPEEAEAVPVTYHCDRCQTSWVSMTDRCWSCRHHGERGQLLTQLVNRHDYSYDGRHAGFTQADADALIVRGDN